MLLVLPAEHSTKLLGDREFIGQHWFLFLGRRKIPLFVRLRANTVVDTPQGKQQIQHALAWMQTGQRTRGRFEMDIYGVRFYISVMRLEHDWCIIAHQQQTRNAFALYNQRWTIETLFASLKSRGFQIEVTHLNDPARLWRLFALLAIALLWAYKSGLFLMEQKAISVKKHGRWAHSITAYGLQELQHSLLNSQHFRQVLISFLGLLSCT